MHRVFSTVVGPLLDATRGQPVLEVGAGAGILTARLVQSTDDTIHAIDPAPQFDPTSIGAPAGRLVLYARRSLSILRGLPPVGLALLDGDPNYYTVANELALLTMLSGDRHGSNPVRDPVIVVHNVGWPFARRDGYYDPQAIPQGSRVAYTQLGLLPGHDAPSPHGLRLVPFVAEEEGLPGTGVLTAVDEFVQAADPAWELIVLPGLHGVAVLASHARLEREPVLRGVFDELGSVRLMRKLTEAVERERIATLLGGQSAASNGSAAHAPVGAPSTAAELGAPASALGAGFGAPASALGAGFGAPGSALAAGLGELEEFEADRLDALQSRLELLERDRDARLRDARARVTALEGQHDRLIREAAQARAQLDDERRRHQSAHDDLRVAEQRIGESERTLARATATQEQLGSELKRAQSHGELLEQHARAESQRLRDQLEAQADAWSSERDRIGDYAERAASSRAWRLGHGLTTIGYRLKLRRSRGTSALGRLQQELSKTPKELDTNDHNTPALPAGPSDGA